MNSESQPRSIDDQPPSIDDQSLDNQPPSIDDQSLDYQPPASGDSHRFAVIGGLGALIYELVFR